MYICYNSKYMWRNMDTLKQSVTAQMYCFTYNKIQLKTFV